MYLALCSISLVAATMLSWSILKPNSALIGQSKTGVTVNVALEAVKETKCENKRLYLSLNRPYLRRPTTTILQYRK